MAAKQGTQIAAADLLKNEEKDRTSQRIKQCLSAQLPSGSHFLF